jgi:drug/metabolite transporter (DMT)-like permease
MTKERVVVEVVVDEAVDEAVQTGNEPPVHPHAGDPTVLRGIELAVFAVFVFASADAMAKYLGKFYPVLGLVWARYAVHMLLMLAWLGPSMKLDLIRTQHLGLQIVRGLLLVGSTCFFFSALKFLPMAEASAIGFISPLLVTVFGRVLLKEKVSPRRWIAVGTGFLGVLIIVRPGGQVFSPAVLLPVAMAVCWSLYQIATRKVRSDNVYATLFYTALVGSVVLSLALPFSWQTPTFFHGLLIATLGMVAGFAHFILIRALGKAPASVLAPFYYTQLIWIILLGYLIFRDFPDGWALLGMVVIVGSGMYVAYGERIHFRKVNQSS